MKIGQFTLSTLCRLAPMAGVSNTPFRVICKEMGSSLTTSEEISAKAILHGNDRTMEMLNYLPYEKPIAFQLFGSEPEDLARAAQIVEQKGADLVDLNMGCPVPKITKTGAGSALMRDELKAAEVFRAIRKSVSIPFTIKIRGGWDDHTINAPQIARIAEAEGVDAIAVHPRTRSQQYTGKAPWDIIKNVVDAVKIPVTGNGDVKNWTDARRMQLETGCQSVMIGRGALGKPWVFHEAFETMSAREQHEFRYQVIQRHLNLIDEHMHPKVALMQVKKHLAWYICGTKESSKARAHVFSLEERSALNDFFFEYWPHSFLEHGMNQDHTQSFSVETSF